VEHSPDALLFSGIVSPATQKDLSVYGQNDEFSLGTSIALCQTRKDSEREASIVDAIAESQLFFRKEAISGGL
jgi:hypothetical protein